MLHNMPRFARMAFGKVARPHWTFVSTAMFTFDMFCQQFGAPQMSDYLQNALLFVSTDMFTYDMFYQQLSARQTIYIQNALCQPIVLTEVL